MDGFIMEISQFNSSASSQRPIRKTRPKIPILQIKENQKLWESDQLLGMLFSHSIEGIWFIEAEKPIRWDESEDKEKVLDYAFEHQHIVRVNKSFCEQYDTTVDQMIGLSLKDFFAHDLKNARKMWRQIFNLGMLTCETMEYKFNGTEKFAGDAVWFLGDYFCIYNSKGEMVGHFGSQRDITDRKLAEQALKESEERYRTIAKNVADGITIIQDKKLLLVNDAFINMFRYSDEKQLVGKNVLTLICHDYKEQFDSLIKNFEMPSNEIKYIRNRKNIFQGIFISRENRKFWAEGQFASIKWKGEKALLCTIRDIHERKLKEIAKQERVDDLHQENIKLRSSIKERYRFQGIIGKSPEMQNVYELIIRAANSNANVLIYGESGTGKELVAQAIFKLSSRSDKKFVIVNCNAIPQSLAESEFFGYKKGAFTGANTDKTGYLKIAEGGVLFLDEVADIDQKIQGKLLRAIEGGGYRPVGSIDVYNSDFRIIAATNKDLFEEVAKGNIREDFYYRIHIINITLPPLRERKEDIPLLIDHFMKEFGQNNASSNLPGKVMEAIFHYTWPGNIRELQNVLHRYITVGHIDFLDCKMASDKKNGEDEDTSDGILLQNEKITYRQRVEVFEKNLILKALNQTNWKRSKAIELLGLPRRTLYNKMKFFGLI